LGAITARERFGKGVIKRESEIFVGSVIEVPSRPQSRTSTKRHAQPELLPRIQEVTGAMIARKDIEARQHAWYVRNCMESAAAAPLEPILLEQLEVLRSRTAGNIENPERPGPFGGTRRGESLADLGRILRSCSAPVPSDDHFEENVSFARDQFGLDPIETQILQLLLRYERNSYLERFADQVSQKLRSAARAVGAMIGVGHRAVQLRLGRTAH
jgi:hypothetical protein